MSNFTYLFGIPAASHNPSTDQPNMLINNDSIPNLISVDHVGFNANNGGYHKLIHQGTQASDPTPIASVSQTYTKTFDGQENLYSMSGTGTIYGVVNKNGKGVVPLISSITVTLNFIVPDNCIGYIVFTNPAVGLNKIMSFSFASFNGVLYTDYAYQAIAPAPPTPIIIGATGTAGNLQIVVAKQNPANPNIVNSSYRYILWPTDAPLDP